jgi:hypothetical protein
MAIDSGPDASTSWVSGPIATTQARVVGLLTVALSGGNAGWRWPAWQIAEAMDAFAPGTVPLIDGHNDTDRPAPIVGYLDRLDQCIEGLRFGGAISDAAMVEWLRQRGAAVSPELRSPGGRGRPDSIVYPRDDPATGPLVAVAILPPDQRPARHGSCVWLA